MSTQPNPRIGSSSEAFLAEEGMLQACEEQAIKELVAEQIARALQEQGLTRTAMAARMRTSRAALNRLLDPTNAAVTLQTLQKAPPHGRCHPRPRHHNPPILRTHPRPR